MGKSAMRFHRQLTGFSADRAWGAMDVGEVDGVTVRVHWTDQPYKWHVNDGAEVFVVLDGSVDMHWRVNGQTNVRRLNAGDACFAELGDEHVAHPVGEARILVVERKGSVWREAGRASRGCVTLRAFAARQACAHGHHREATREPRRWARSST